MPRRYDDDDDGQVEGDGPPPGNPFATSMHAAPWLRGGMPPWHLWGNTQQIVVPIETTGALRKGVTNQLIRIAYRRPETWRWLFSARLLAGPDNTAGFFTRLFVHWELTVGVGRSVIQMAFGEGGRAFEDYVFQWGPINPAFPRGAQIWTSETASPARTYTGDGGNLPGPPSPLVVAEDIQLQVQIVGLTVVDNLAAVGQNATVEVSAQFAPNVHVRPDWLRLDVPPEAQFPGAEIEGR